jgi:hypothetical protein
VDQLAALIERLPRLQLIKAKENPALALGSGMAARLFNSISKSTWKF